MKSYILLSIFFLSIFTLSLQAQSVHEINSTESNIKKNGKYAMLVSNTQHLNAAIITGENFKNRSSNIDFQIVACGGLVKEISMDKSLQNKILEAIGDHQLKILICGLSIKQLNIDAALISTDIPVTENGLIYMFGLQERKYKTIIL